MPEFKDEIKILRERREITQADAAKLCGVSTRTFLAWERGEVHPMRPVRVGVLQILKPK